jgi:hypothetical protein
MRTLLTVVLVLGAAGLSGGCARTMPGVSSPVRVLSSEPATSPRAEPEGSSSERLPTPRIGAPGGSGAGSRRVAPAQSGNDAVGGLPTGAAGVVGRG